LGQLELNTDTNFKERITLFADVLLPVPIPKLFTYRVPFEFNDRIDVGWRVVVQFGKRKVITGVVARLHENAPREYSAKYLIDLLDDGPMVKPRQLELFDWIAEYYMCTPGEVLNAAMPSGLKLSSESKIQLNPAFDFESSRQEFSDLEMLILNVLERDRVIAYSEAERILQIKSYLKVIKSLIGKGAILIFEEVKEKYSPRRECMIRLASHWLMEGNLQELLDELEKRPKQQEVVMAYLKEVPVFQDKRLNKPGIAKKKLLAEGISASSLRTLIKNKVLESIYRTVPRFDLSSEKQRYDISLSGLQKQVVKEILIGFEKKQTVLFHGVTGSGKTEIYIELIKEVLNHGDQVLYLLPEIALTTQIVARLQKVFGDRMGVYHSKHSVSERVEVWKGLMSGRFTLIVGVRSSVFLPFEQLGLIIIDEEHEPSYKQYDPAPRYHARDVAQVMGRMYNARVLMGTATPSFEAYYLAQSRSYGYVALNERFGAASLPAIRYADIIKARKQKRLKGDFTTELIDGIAQTLAKEEQVIIFQNRRGYAPYISCDDCGWIPQCNNCSVSLTFHMYYNQLRCHYCGHHERLPVTCPACGSAKLRTRGFGTEKLEDDLKLLFPEARIVRMDLDTTRRKYSYQNIINDFEHGVVDILVGTQMVSKGLNFDRVTLVGVFDIDRMLHFPDFRSTERAFQLAVQVSGRAGRKEKPGEVIIQSSNLNQPILHDISSQDYAAFYSREIEERQKYHYPPFYRLIAVTLKHREQPVLMRGAEDFAGRIQGCAKSMTVLGPHEPMVGRIRNYYLQETIIKIPRGSGELKEIKQKLQQMADEVRQQREFRQLIISFNVDPY
jgi:primosomal protein N' (replication factor Y)